MLIHSDPNNMNSIVYHLIIVRYSMKTLHWYFPWATALYLYNMTSRGGKLQQLHCYHTFSDSLDIYLTKNHYENYSPKMVPIAKIWGPGSWTNCPVKLLQKYLALRPSGPGPVFVSTLGKPISRQQFLGALHSSVRFRSLDPSLYNTHSFRIGRSTDMTFQGYSDAQIRAVGRWKSDAYKRNIRPDMIYA